MPPRTRLRVPTRADLPFLRALWADPETMAPVGGPIALSDERAEAWFRRMVDPGAPTDRFFLVEDAQGRAVGEISFHRRDAQRGTAGLNVKVIASRRREGLGRAAMESFLAWYFDDFGAREITDDLALGNAGGRQLLEAFGFVHDPSVPGVQFLRLSRDAWAARRGRDGSA